MKISKKIITASLIAALACTSAIALTACGDKNTSTTSSHPKIDFSASFPGYYDFTYQDYFFEKAGDDEVIGIKFNWTNNTGEKASFYWENSWVVTQNGKELENWLYVESNGDTTDTQMTEIEAGASKDTIATFKIVDKTSPITVTIEPILGFDIEPASFTINLV